MLAQQDGESIDKFVTRLRESAARCQFHDTSREIKDQIVQKCISERLRRKALREDPSLEALLRGARAMELSNAQAAIMEDEANMNRIRKRGKYSSQGKADNGANKQKDGEKKSKLCYSCGEIFPHKGGRKNCPAFGKECDTCGKKGHFARLCNKKETKAVEADSSSDTDDDYVLAAVRKEKEINAVGCKKVETRTTVGINDVPVRMQIDSGADVNTVTEEDFSGRLKEKVTLVPTRARLFPYKSKTPLELLGKFTASVSTKKGYDVADFYVVKGDSRSGSLLGAATAISLGLLKIEVNSVETEPRVKKGPSLTQLKRKERKIKDLVKEFDEVFHGIGKMKGVKVKLHVDPDVKPVAQKHRRVPFHLREKLEKELERLEQAGIIEKVDTATDWVSPLVLTPKKGTDEIRMCVDMVQPNKAIKRVRHVIPTVEELRHDMNGMTVFSKLDLNNGFHQLELDEESRHMTTFSSHKGLARYCRLNFGTNSAPEVFHEELRKKLATVNGVRNIHDDILVAGVDDKDHLRALRDTLKVLRDNGLTAKKSKCVFGKPSVEFLGSLSSNDGIHPNPIKVKALKTAVPPCNKKKLRSFLGITNFKSQIMHD